ncbi:MAG: GNAT family N-acetyltransferase [Myxococcota bacterium]
MVTLRTERLVLRVPDRSAAPMYDAFYTDPEASRHYNGPLTSAQAWARLASDIGFWHLQGFGVWMIERADRGGALVGVCGFWQGLGWPRELTWWLIPSARGSGIASEASRAAIDHAYRGFGWDAVETYLDDDNVDARRLVVRLGGTVVDRPSFPDGRSRDRYRLPRPG